MSGYQGYARLDYTRGDLRAQLSYNRFEAEVTAPFQLRPYAPVADVFQAQIRRDVKLGDSHLVTGGVQYRLLSVDSALFANGGGTQHLGSFFLQDQWSLLKNLVLTVGVGVEVHPETGVSASPRGALVFTPWPDHAFRVSVARALRNPSFNENFLVQPTVGVVPGFSGVVPVLGNDRLRPEEMRAYEVGYQGRLFGRVRVWADFFYNQLDNLIGPRLVPEGVQLVNVPSGDTYGTEVGIDTLLTAWLSGFANYTYLERKGSTDPNTVGLASNHKANLGLAARLPWGFSASGTGSYVGAPENSSPGLNAYFLVNLRVANAFKVMGAAAELSLEVFNLFNDRHREVTGGDVIDRRISGSLRVRF